MVKRVTIEDVARLAGVNKGTVSRALNERTRHQVSAETLERVRLAAERLDYAPDLMARSLRTRTSMTVGVVIPDLTNPFFPPIVRGIESHLSPQGYSVLVANTDGRDLVERAAISTLLDRRVDGLVIASGHLGGAGIDEPHRVGVPAVLVNRSAGDSPYPLVAGADADGIAFAVEHLVGLGHRELLHVAGPLEVSTSTTRSAAFESACARAGAAGRIVVAPALSVEAGRATMDAVLDGSRRPTGVVAGNDLIALGVLRAMRARGLRCPEDLSVVGFNDMPFAEDFAPPLTTVRVPTHELGVAAARLLLRAIADRDEQEADTVLLPVSLVVRGSTGPVARG